jgi:hypothetical protein
MTENSISLETRMMYRNLCREFLPTCESHATVPDGMGLEHMTC